ncbi:putative regulation of meiosis-related protein [Papiliotrema laurentii]|uniref:Regulation of meiosis-related protein n=1 Tax=Papiliotrema laurentii TaxID=5418 RepID=A0AAD9FTS8_PAPLA|nr:putative regulation of meiosis-related protein [Papiliotrema laurentii]
MPGTIHTFPSPPRPKQQKRLNGHAKPDGLAQENGHGGPSSSSSAPETLQHVSPTRSRSEAGSEIMDYDSDGEEMVDQGVLVHVEVRLHEGIAVNMSLMRRMVLGYIFDTLTVLTVGRDVQDWEEVDAFRNTVAQIRVAESSNGQTSVEIHEADVLVHVYSPSYEAPLESFGNDDEDSDDDEERVPSATVRQLPSLELDGLWENLIYADDIKSRLLNYIYSTTAFSDAGIDFNVVTWNRMVLLHGPPGTGKTSLCRALAQKLSIRLSKRYPRGAMVEINSHSLFSKWFSESGKLVQKLFSSINKMVDDPDCFVVVMIDEVESLTAARASAMNGNEPGDAVRVVNALLTQLDKLKMRQNVLVMTTSNIAGAIDPAFVDRADIKELVGLPPPEAIHWILASCLAQLVKGGMIKEQHVPSWQDVKHQQSMGNSTRNLGSQLFELAEKCHTYGLAGRFLRRLPVLAHARYIASALAASTTKPPSMRRWIQAMDKVVDDEHRSRMEIAAADGHRREEVERSRGVSTASA